MLKPLTWLLPLLKVLEIHNGGKDLPQMQSCPGRQGLPLKEWATGQIEVPIPKANPNANPLFPSEATPHGFAAMFFQKSMREASYSYEQKEESLSLPCLTLTPNTE